MLQHNKRIEQRLAVYSVGGFTRIGEPPLIAIGPAPDRHSVTIWLANSYHQDNVTGSLRRSAKIQKTRLFVVEQRGYGAKRWRRIRLLSVVITKVSTTRDDIIIEGKVVRDVEQEEKKGKVIIKRRQRKP